MNEARPAEAAPVHASSAGAMLRQAREEQGLEIAALAATLKVPPRKLELLEQDRFDELHDATFARALAQGVCRALRIEPAPVMALLPHPPSLRLDHLNQGLNTPFRERTDGLAGRNWSLLARPVVWAPSLIVLAALVLYFYPSAAIKPARSVVVASPGPDPAGPPVGVPARPAGASSAAVVETVHSAPPPAAADATGDASSAAATVNGMLQLRTTTQSWVEVLDARGQMLLSRVIQPGETIGLDGPLPLKVKIGNSAGTQLIFRGEPVELTPFSRENVAKLELK